jgi:hypothetical protein
MPSHSEIETAAQDWSKTKEHSPGKKSVIFESSTVDSQATGHRERLVSSLNSRLDECPRATLALAQVTSQIHSIMIRG